MASASLTPDPGRTTYSGCSSSGSSFSFVGGRAICCFFQFVTFLHYNLNINKKKGKNNKLFLKSKSLSSFSLCFKVQQDNVFVQSRDHFSLKPLHTSRSGSAPSASATRSRSRRKNGGSGRLYVIRPRPLDPLFRPLIVEQSFDSCQQRPRAKPCQRFSKVRLVSCAITTTLKVWLHCYEPRPQLTYLDVIHSTCSIRSNSNRT